MSPARERLETPRWRLARDGADATDAPSSRMLNPTALDEFTAMRRASSLVSHSAMFWLIKIEITIAFH
jgi:hypothetical protein